MQNNSGKRVETQNIEGLHRGNTDEMDAIRQNEAVGRKKRQQRAQMLNRKERLKRAKMQRIMTMVKAWATLIGIIAVAIAVIIFIVSAVKKLTDDTPDNPNIVGEDITALSEAFYASEGILYSSDENALISDSNKLISNIALSSVTEEELTDPSAFLWNVKRFVWHSDRQNLELIKKVLRDYPIFSNGYVWSSVDSMKSNKNNGYLYDTNARFISAICEIALWEADTYFLSDKDTTGEARLDASLDKTIEQKLVMATDYFFDQNDLNGGGIRYNEADGLVYILTESNNGLSEGVGSNYWFNHRFGYLDAYNNIAFNEAMVHLSKLYNLMGQSDKSEQYNEIAKKNKAAINKMFWNETSGRYIGCIDSDGRKHDLGFTFLNLEAVSSGIADKDKASKILDWLDGKGELKKDTSDGDDIYAYGFAPRSTTIAANNSWWDDAEGRYDLESGSEFGRNEQNGGASLVTAYYDLLARKYMSDKQFRSRYGEFLQCYKDGTVPKSKVSQDKAVASMAVYGLFGLDSDGTTLYVRPAVGEHGGDIGIKNIGFGINSYDLFFGKDVTMVFANHSSAVRLNLGGFNKETEYSVRVVENGEYTTDEPVKTDKDGNLVLSERFGGEKYLVIRKIPDD